MKDKLLQVGPESKPDKYNLSNFRADPKEVEDVDGPFQKLYGSLLLATYLNKITECQLDTLL